MVKRKLSFNYDKCTPTLFVFNVKYGFSNFFLYNIILCHFDVPKGQLTFDMRILFNFCVDIQVDLYM